MNVFVGAHSLSSIPDNLRHRVGNLFSPGSFWNSGLQFALDNYVFASHKKNIPWDPSKFVKHLDSVKKSGRQPLFVVVPDAVGDASLTSRKWLEWAPLIEQDYGFPMAFAVQDGHSPKDVPSNATVVFIGGTTGWKRRNIRVFCDHFPRVHVARINTYRWLLYCHECGAESVDGTGWFWKGKREYWDLLDYLNITEGNQTKESGALFPLYPYIRIPDRVLLNGA